MEKLVTLKLESGFLEQVDSISRRLGFGTRAEFIRSALRDKLSEARRQEALALLEKGRGAGEGHGFSDEKIEVAREEVAKELIREFG